MLVSPQNRGGATPLISSMAEPSNSYNLYLSATDILVSCSVCQDTLSSIYAEDDGNLGLRKSDDPHNGRITKLWLTECAHLTCGKHLEGGGKRYHDPYRPSTKR